MAIWACKSEEEAGIYNSIIGETIAGQWKLVADEKGIIGQSSWIPVQMDSTKNVIFRSDGLPLTNTGLPACCAPKALTINGRFVEIKPVGALAPNPACATINCGNCPNWDITLTGNEMIIAYCNTSRKKYVRI